MATRTRTAPAKKSVASRRPAPAKKTTPAPAKKAAPAPAKRTPAKKALAPQPESLPKSPATKPKLQAHDVLRAHLDMLEAQQVFAELHKAYWAEYGVAVDFAVDHSKAVMELDAPKQNGPKRKDGPVRNAMVEEEDRVIGETFDREKLELKPLPELRALFKDLVSQDERLEPTTKKAEILSQLEENGYFREEVDADSDEADDEGEEALGAEDEDEEYEEDDSDDSDDEDSDEEEDDDDEEGGYYTPEDIDEMDLKQLREFAEENGVTTKGKKEAALRAELKELVGDDEEEPDDADEDEEDDGYLTVEDLEEMTLEELQDTAKRTGDNPPLNVFKNAAKLRKWLEPYLEGDEDEDDEE